MAKYVGRNAAQKEFVKKFDMLTGSRSRWQVWQDMVWLFATAISNAVDKRFFEQREKTHTNIISQYKPTEQQVFPELFAMLTLTMEESEAGFSDFLGELYMDLELGFKGTGQFFTPYHVCKAMAKISVDTEKAKAQIDRQGYISVCDPACGAGATLIAAADVLRDSGINYQQTALFAAQDIDSTVALMCYIQLSLLGCAGYVVIGNTITEPMTGISLFGEPDRERCWYTPMYFTERWSTLRAIEQWRRVFATVATPPPAAPEPASGAALETSIQRRLGQIFDLTEAVAAGDLRIPQDSQPSAASGPQAGLESIKDSNLAPSREREPAAESAAPAAQEPMVFTVTNDKKQIEGQLTMF